MYLIKPKFDKIISVILNTLYFMIFVCSVANQTQHAGRTNKYQSGAAKKIISIVIAQLWLTHSSIKVKLFKLFPWAKLWVSIRETTLKNDMAQKRWTCIKPVSLAPLEANNQKLLYNIIVGFDLSGEWSKCLYFLLIGLYWLLWLQKMATEKG